MLKKKQREKKASMTSQKCELTITSTKCQYMKYNTIVVKKKNKNKCISINDSF
jgi:hypothetical protein